MVRFCKTYKITQKDIMCLMHVICNWTLCGTPELLIWTMNWTISTTRLVHIVICYYINFGQKAPLPSPQKPFPREDADSAFYCVLAGWLNKVNQKIFLLYLLLLFLFWWLCIHLLGDLLYWWLMTATIMIYFCWHLLVFSDTPSFDTCCTIFLKWERLIN